MTAHCAQTNPKEGDALRASVLDGFDFAINAPRSKARSNDDSIEAGQLFYCAVGCNGFAVNPVHLHIDLLVGTRMNERFRDGFVAVFQLHVFADQANFHGRLWVLVLREEFLPSLKIQRLFCGGHPQFFEHDLVQAFFHQQQRHVIDGFRIDALDDCAGGDVAEARHFGAHRVGEFVFRSAHQDVRLNTEFEQLLHGVLGRFGLELSGCRRRG